MKEYVVKGNAIEVTLDDGRVVKVAAKYIQRMVDNLEIDEEEAILTWLEDEEYLTNDEQEELVALAKENKSVKIIDAIVAAFRLNPSQLRIASLITRKPDEEDSHSPKEPEVARIYDKAIIIESYLTKK